MSDFNFTAAAVAVVAHERRTARLEGTYDGLAAFYHLDSASKSDALTDTARDIVLIGANNDGTATGAKVTAEDLTGRDPGAGAAHRDYWKAARSVRVGLVRAIARAAGDDESDDDTAETVVNLLTRAGLKADLEDVIRAWKTAHESN